MRFKKIDRHYIRIMLLIVTAMFIVLFLMTLGNVLYGHRDSYIIFYDSGNTDEFNSPTVFTHSVFFGVALLTIGLFVHLTNLTSPRMVCMYSYILMIIFTFKLGVVFITFVLENDKPWSRCDIPVSAVRDPDILAEVDFVQTKLGCCGNNDYKDYMGIEFPRNASTIVVNEIIDDQRLSLVLPASCCMNPEEVYCTKIWPTGCKHVLIKTITNNGDSNHAFATYLRFTNILSIILALLLTDGILKLQSERLLIIRQIEAQTNDKMQMYDLYRYSDNKLIS